MVVAVGALLLLGGLNKPLDFVPLVQAWQRHETIYTPKLERAMTADLYKGLTWIRGHTSPDAVLAVNNHYVDRAERKADYFYYSAFSERRVFLESWFFTAAASKAGFGRVWSGELNPYAQRLALNDAVFSRADPAALRTLARDYGVDYLVVDRRNGGPDPGLARRARLVYSNPDVVVYSIAGAQRAA